MKIRKTIITLLFVVLSIWNLSTSIFAMQTGFTTKEVSTEKRENILSNIDLKITMQEAKDLGISCFDVSDNETIAIGASDAVQKYVYIYNKYGVFQYGYSFNSSGSFNIEWDNENIIIYFVRSDLAASFDENGNNIELRRIENTTENYSYWNQLDSSKRIVNGTSYTIENNIGLLKFLTTSRSQLVKTEANGDVTILYDVKTGHVARAITLLVVIIVIFIVAVLCIKPYFVINNQNK